ncbi:MAG: YafY family protein [Paracoccaceae bacterium]
MARAQRLLALMETLRQHRRPVQGAVLAENLGVSLRTLYRDIDTLRSHGAVIEGEAGLGFVLRPGHVLPPLMLTPDEVEALVLGIRWVTKRTDADLGRAAEGALAKIGAVLPPDLRNAVDSSTMIIGPGMAPASAFETLPAVRAALRQEHRLAFGYTDAQGVATNRIIWPIALGFFDTVRVVVGWCEARQAYRHFRLDRMTDPHALGRYAKRRNTLLAEWREAEGIPPL